MDISIKTLEEQAKERARKQAIANFEAARLEFYIAEYLNEKVRSN